MARLLKLLRYNVLVVVKKGLMLMGELMSEKFICPNCQTENHVSSHFCSQCSQKANLKLNSVWRMMIDFFANLIDYDSKLFSSMRGIFTPGFLTNQYLLKRRVPYLSPMRMFVFFMFVLFATLSYRGVNELIFNFSGDEKQVTVNSGISEDNYRLLEKFSPKFKIQSLIRSLSNELQKRSEKLAKEIAVLKKAKDLTGHNKIVKQLALIEAAIKNIDALENAIAINDTDTFDFQLAFKKYTVKVSDINSLTAKQLIEKYKVEGWLEKLMVKQAIKFNKDSKAFGQFLFQNLTWVVLFDVLIMSLLFKLFYFRPKRLYAEHFIFQLHVRTFLFIVGIVILLIPWEFSGTMVTFSYIFLAVYIFLAFKRVYKQSFILTLFKFLILTLLELIILVLVFVTVVFVSSLLFQNEVLVLY
jgi:hypothetical protein